MPEVKIEIIDTNVKFDKNSEEDIVSQIVKDFDKWDAARQPQLDIINRLAELLDIETPEVEYETTFNSEDGSVTKKTVNKIKDSDILQLYNSAIAASYNSNFKIPSQMFNVELENQLNNADKAQLAYLQKQSLLNIWKKAKGKKQGRKACENLYSKGEMIFFINWAQNFQNIRRKNPVNKTLNVLGKSFGIKLPEWQVQRVLKSEGVKVLCIDPENIVFDVTREDEEGCPWIYRSFSTYYDIANNTEYQKFLDDTALQELKDLTKNNSSKDLNNVDSSDELNKNKAVKDNQIEILEFFGDISINNDGDSKFYRNLRIVVIGRSHVAAFEYNPNIINPFVYSAPRRHKDTGRGVPALSFIIPMTEATEEIVNKINKSIGLNINKCFIAPKGALVGKQEVVEGGVIEYEPTFITNPNAQIKEMDFHSGLPAALEFLNFIEGKKEQAFGRYKYSTGDTGVKPRTKYEASIIQSGQDNYISYENDIIGNEAIIPVFEKIGEFQANFQDKPQAVKYKDNTGAERMGIMDDTVWNSSFVYTVGDTQTETEKATNQEQFLLGLEKISALLEAQGKRLKAEEIINQWGAINKIEEPTKFIEDIPMTGGLMNEPSGQAGMPEGIQPNPNAGLEGNQGPLPAGNI